MTYTSMESSEYVSRLSQACGWLGIERGRAREYETRLKECNEIKTWSPEYTMSYFESYEIVELFKLWNQRVDDFPGLKEKIREACQKGPFLPEHEMPSASSNRPRNDAFAYLVAGKFLSAGISVVSVDGVASRHFECKTQSDFAFVWEAKEYPIAVECKRPQSIKKLTRLAKEARDQIDSSQFCGIIAIDCSVLCRPAGTVYETSSAEGAEAEFSKRLEDHVVPKISVSGSQRILGHMLFARIPAMTALNTVDSRGHPIRRRDCISSWLCVGGSRGCPNWEIIKKITCMLKNQRTRELVEDVS